MLEDLTPTEYLEIHGQTKIFLLMSLCECLVQKLIVLINSGMSIQDKKGNIFRDITAHTLKRYVT